MSFTALGFPARQRHVDVQMLDLEHAKRDATRVKRIFRAENPLEIRRLDAEHLKVDVLDRLDAQQQIAHGTAHHQRPSARILHQGGDVLHRRQQLRLQNVQIESSSHTLWA